jgi:hypothetical protein
MTNDIEYAFLNACQEVVWRQQELVPALAKSLGVTPTEVFYHWVCPPRCEQVGTIASTEWRYFFHGLECDLRHQDGRSLRVDFGPGGRFDTFTGWGVLQFIMTSKAPWKEFPELRTHLTDKSLPSDTADRFSGNHKEMTVLVSRLEECGWIEVADADLCALTEQCTTIDSEGRRMVKLPKHLTGREVWDTMACHRLVLSDLGKQMLAKD